MLNGHCLTYMIIKVWRVEVHAALVCVDVIVLGQSLVQSFADLHQGWSRQFRESARRHNVINRIPTTINCHQIVEKAIFPVGHVEGGTIRRTTESTNGGLAAISVVVVNRALVSRQRKRETDAAEERLGRTGLDVHVRRIRVLHVRAQHLVFIDQGSACHHCSCEVSAEVSDDELRLKGGGAGAVALVESGDFQQAVLESGCEGGAGQNFNQVELMTDLYPSCDCVAEHLRDGRNEKRSKR